MSSPFGEVARPATVDDLKRLLQAQAAPLMRQSACSTLVAESPMVRSASLWGGTPMLAGGMLRGAFICVGPVPCENLAVLRTIG